MITTEKLFMRFPDGSGIRYADAAFESGRSYALLGASGCGKSTFLNLIAGILTPAEGRVSIGGEIVSALPQARRDRLRIQKIGHIFQDFKLLEDMTVADNINLLRLEGVDTSGMDALLDRLGILRLKKRRVNRLSGGEKQRVAIARALIKRPSIILADEPTGNLNFDTGVEAVDALLANAGNCTVVAVTHDDRLAARFDVRMDMNRLAAFVPGGEAANHA